MSGSSPGLFPRAALEILPTDGRRATLKLPRPSVLQPAVQAARWRRGNTLKCVIRVKDQRARLSSPSHHKFLRSAAVQVPVWSGLRSPVLQRSTL